MMQADDNPPIGLLLCTDYGETTVLYTTEGLSQNLFVSVIPTTASFRGRDATVPFRECYCRGLGGVQKRTRKGKRNVTCKMSQYLTELPSKELTERQIHKGLEAARQR